MKRVNDYFVPSVTEITKAIQHFNRLNNASANFYADHIRFRWWRLYWLPGEGHFSWQEYCNQHSYTVWHCPALEISLCERSEKIRDQIFRWAEGLPF